MQAKRNNRQRRWVAVVALCLAGISAHADPIEPIQVARRGGDSGVSLNEAVQQAQQQSGGRVLSADTVNQGGRAVHRIKVLTPSGQVRVYTFDGGGR